MNADTQFAKEIERELLGDIKPIGMQKAAPVATARGDLESARALLGAIGNDITVLQNALKSMATAVEKMQMGLREAEEMVARAKGRL